MNINVVQRELWDIGGTNMKRKPTMAVVFVLAIILVGAEGMAREQADPQTPLPIIPGARGFGMETVAGSGRHLNPPKTRVIKVTNLNTNGSGSLREAFEAKGPRVVVFEVSGNIDCTPYGGLSIRNPYITIAGQTAPSPGITLKGCELNISTHDVLLQHIRVRVGDLLDPTQSSVDKRSGWSQWSERDSMKLGGNRIVVDHCSFSWATDENVQTRVNDATLIHNIFSEGLQSKKHHKGGHSRGLLILNQGSKNRNEGQNIAVIGNLFVHNKGRNPVATGPVTAVIVNNLVDDAHFAMKADDIGTSTAKKWGGYLYFSMMGNVIKRTRYPVVMLTKDPGTRIYLAPDNTFNGQAFDSYSDGGKKDVWNKVLQPFGVVATEAQMTNAAPVVVFGLKVRPAAEVEEWVLANAGARPADRDPVDTRMITDVRNGTGKIISSQKDVGGWPKLAENHRKLIVPANPGGDDDNDGYTNLEEWLHSFANRVEGRGK